MTVPVKTCPRCCQTLTRAKGPDMVLDICMDCGGTHFDHGELAKMARTRPDELDDVERLVERHPYSVKIVISRELLCAACGTPMETYEYAFTSGVLLDRCPKCYAVWADDGELQGIQDHIEGRPDPGTQGEEALDPEVRAQMLLNDVRAGSGSKTGRLGALTSLARRIFKPYPERSGTVETRVAQGILQSLESDAITASTRTPEGDTPLHAAARLGSIELAQHLLERGADPNPKGEFGATPLRVAAEEGRLDIVSFLLKRGADINAADDDGFTPLHKAAGFRRLDVVHLLLTHGADLDARDTKGRTPLFAAVAEATADRGTTSVAIAELLLDHGADANAKDGNGETPLCRAKDQAAQLLREHGAKE